MGLTAILPAAGKAERLYGLPKFLLPVPGGCLLKWHVDQHRTAGATVHVGTRPVMSGLVAQYSGGFSPAYMIHEGTMVGTVHSGQQYTGVQDVLMSMPDTYWEDTGLIERMREALGEYEVVMGVFETRPEQRHKLGMCAILNDQVVEVVDKPAQTHLVWAWGCLGWRKEFWGQIKKTDNHFGESLNRAIGAGFKIGAVYASGRYWDCGTLEEYADCLHSLLEKEAV